MIHTMIAIFSKIIAFLNAMDGRNPASVGSSWQLGNIVNHETMTG